MKGPMEASFRREYVSTNQWRFITSQSSISIQLSPDRQDVVSLSMADAKGKTMHLEAGMEMWYTPQTKLQAPIITGTQKCTSALGTHTCRIAEHTDAEGNHFRWYLLDEVPGGVLQFEALFEGKEQPIQFQMNRHQVPSK